MTDITYNPSVQCQNDRGEWVPAIPMPFYVGRRGRTCDCGRQFNDEESYRGHYALVHILGLS